MSNDVRPATRRIIYASERNEMMASDFDTRASPSTTDVSEDSVDVKVKPVALSSSMSAAVSNNRKRNKRKSAEPRKLKEVVPVIERHRWTSNDGIVEVIDAGTDDDDDDDDEEDGISAKVLKVPLVRSSTLIENLKKRSRRSSTVLPSTSTSSSVTWSQKRQRKTGSNKRSTKKGEVDVALPVPTAKEDDYHQLDGKQSLAYLGLPFDVRNILGPPASSLLRTTSSPGAFERFKNVGAQISSKDDRRTESVPNYEVDEDEDGNVDDDDDDDVNGSPSDASYLHGQDGESESASVNNGRGNRLKQRNYKNMTRERRVEANARERTRVHTISAAFDNLRRAVPSYSCHQKLSKLAILRIACSYILALASLNDKDYSSQQDCPTFSECVDLCTRTIQAEGKARKRKD